MWYCLLLCVQLCFFCLFRSFSFYFISIVVAVLIHCGCFALPNAAFQKMFAWRCTSLGRNSCKLVLISLFNWKSSSTAPQWWYCVCCLFANLLFNIVHGYFTRLARKWFVTKRFTCSKSIQWQPNHSVQCNVRVSMSDSHCTLYIGLDWIEKACFQICKYWY